MSNRVFIRGISDKGDQVIAKLRSLGGIDPVGFEGCSLNCYYFINCDNNNNIGIKAISPASKAFFKRNGYKEIKPK